VPVRRKIWETTALSLSRNLLRFRSPTARSDRAEEAGAYRFNARPPEASAREGAGSMGLLRLSRDLSVSILRHARQAQPPVHLLALREVYWVVARRPGTEPGYAEIGHKTLSDRADFGGLREQPGKR